MDKRCYAIDFALREGRHEERKRIWSKTIIKCACLIEWKK